VPRRIRVPPALLAALGYLVVALVVLGPSIRPGHTLVPADALTQYSPFREAAGGFRADNPIVSDAATQFYPWMKFLGEHVRADGHFPTWNPLILGGVPVDPNGYVNAWYPATSLLRVLDAFDAYNLFVLLHLVIGALGIYALSRTLGARPWSSWIVGVLAMAAGAWLHWSLHLVHVAGMVWLPWALAAGWRVVDAPTRRRTAVFALVLALWWLGGNPQYTYFGGLALAGWLAGALVFRRTVDRESLVRPIVAIAIAFAAGVLVALPTLYPYWAGSGDIVRTAEPEAAVVQTHLPLRHGIRILVPDAVGNPADGFLYATGDEFAMDSPFVGVITVVLAGAALGFGLRRHTRSDRRIALLGLGVAAALVLAFVGPEHVVLRLLPGYDRFRGSARWVAVLPAFALPLAALGIDALADGDRRARRAAIRTATGLGVVVVLWLARESLVDTSPHAYLLRRGLFAIALAAAIALATYRPRWVVPVALACAAVEVGFAAPKWFPDVTESTAYPSLPAITAIDQRGGRFTRVGGPRDLPGYFPPDIAMAYGLSDTSGLTPLFPADYDRYLRLVDDYGATARELNVAPPLATDEDLRSNLLDALDVRTAIRARGRTTPRDAPGPAIVVPDAQPAATTSEMWDAVGAPGFDPSSTSWVTGLDAPVTGDGGTVERVATGAGGDADAPDHERWRVDAPSGGFLRVAGRYDRGWSATIDGRPVAVHRADGTFRGVVVPAGTHLVRFDHTDDDTRRTLRVAVPAALLLVAAAALRRPRTHSRKSRTRG